MMKKNPESENIKHLEAIIAEGEKDLRLKIRRGKTEEAVQIFNALFDAICLVHDRKIDMIKCRVLELLVWLTRSVSDIGIRDENYHRNNALLYEELYHLNDPEAIRKLMTKTIELFIAVVAEAEKDNTLQSVYTVAEYIQSHFKEKVTIEDIAATVHLNASYTSHLFRKTFGYTITDYITYIRLENAKTVLADVNANINEAAMESGFSDVSYFSRVFKKIEGLSPREYKNKLKK